MLRLFHSCSSDVLLELGRSFCGSFYCSHLWTCYKRSSFSKIRVAYNFYRKILHVPGRSSASAMFVENNIPNFECLIRRIANKLEIANYSFTSRQGRQSRGVGGVATPPEFWKGGLNPP